MAQTSIRPGDTPQKPTDPKKPSNKPPAILMKNAEKFGYNLVHRPDGSWVIKDPRVGYHQMTPDEIKFLQHAANKYDIATPGIADFNNSAYINGAFYHLNTGQGQYNGDQALSDEQLAAARARAGWTPETGQAKALADWQQMQKELGNPGSGEIPAWLATPEGYQAQIDSQRAAVNGQAAAAAGTGEGTFQPFTDVSGTQQGVPGYPVTQYQTAAEGLQAAHAALASHYASAATAGDFATATALQSTLAQHQALMPQNTSVSYTAPDTFSESDLYLAQSQ